ncbi:MAG: hypothetical protein V4488_16760 [Pseudomonadota bacterium]
MKSTEVYSSLKHEMGSVLETLGFKRGRSFLSWHREYDGQFTVLWCQVSRDGWDSYAGSKFTVEFQRSTEPEPGAPAIRRKRIGKLLSNDQREEVRRIQNEILSSLRRPPKDNAIFNVSPEVTKYYLAQFNNIDSPYTASDDVWLRYAAPEHVQTWGTLLANLVPLCIQAVEE